MDSYGKTPHKIKHLFTFFTMATKILISRHSKQLLRVTVSGIFLISLMFHLLKPEKTIEMREQANFKGIAYFF
jgi:putative oxidoreductase